MKTRREEIIKSVSIEDKILKNNELRNGVILHKT